MIRNGFLRTWSLALILAAAGAAAPYSAVVVYGDSLSDNGNLAGLLASVGQPWPANYFPGRASNGPVAAELLAANLGSPLLNYAFAGATTGIGNNLDTDGNPATADGTVTNVGPFGFPGMMQPYGASLSTVGPLASSALFIVWGGVNDFLSPSPLDADAVATADRAVANLVSIVTGLQTIGAQHILVPGLPDLGLVPYQQNGPPGSAALASAVSAYFNARLTSMLPSGVTYFDTSALLHAVIANPGAYGLTNVTDACYDRALPAPPCANPGEHLFFDDIHPSARGHQILAASFADAIAPEPIPEPATFSLAACALGFWCFRAARVKAAGRQ